MDFGRVTLPLCIRLGVLYATAKVKGVVRYEAYIKTYENTDRGGSSDAEGKSTRTAQRLPTCPYTLFFINVSFIHCLQHVSLFYFPSLSCCRKFADARRIEDRHSTPFPGILASPFKNKFSGGATSEIADKGL